ncbi:MAG: cell shape determination protein CcmA [Flavobacteriales bacterium]|nr:cell shape determination protein CcmA [Flavobacteriales bacterium]|tara:strand:- start:1491 stop:1892 length:402 start_codon:yes stop_codon:yes gene_type:complete
MARITNETDNSINIIRSGTEIKGDIRCNGDIRIDGKLVGNLISEGKVVVGEQGVVEGTIKCANATISGGVKVNIAVNELLSLKTTANLVGEISTNKLQIEPGANFSGNCKMGAVIKGIDEGKGEKEEPKEKSA